MMVFRSESCPFSAFEQSPECKSVLKDWLVYLDEVGISNPYLMGICPTQLEIS